MYTLIQSSAHDSTPQNNSRTRNPYENLRLYPLTEALDADYISRAPWVACTGGPLTTEKTDG